LNVVEIVPGLEIGSGRELSVLAGPCVVEDRDFMVRMAGKLRSIAERHGVPLIFKSSIDKANRSSVRSPRGPGWAAGLEILADVKARCGLPVLTDIHEPTQAEPAAEVVDVLQIPAFLSRQTDLLLAAAGTGKPVNVKKGQFLSPGDMANVVAKLVEGGTKRILVTERGVSFGYNNLVVDFRALPQMRALGYPVVLDSTHSVQLPGGLGSSSGGQREFVAPLARAAAAVGIDALFVEVHEDPDRAPSDGPNMLTPDSFDRLLGEVLAIRGSLASPSS
jgi:2-dehydro-3-deoxyphosphooctonate aldolase (KDO 8-P synthase)